MCELSKNIQNVMQGFELSDEQLQEISKIMRQEFDKGLAGEESSIKMLPSYVRDVPDGTEEGKFLALDLGGSKFRVLLIELKGKQFKMEKKKYLLQKEDMQGSGEKLFDNIAESLSDFITEYKLEKESLPLGFTFSFPCKQNSLDESILIHWTKNFKCSGVEGQDVVKLLRAAIQRKGDIEIDVIAVVNDTVGTLMSCAHLHENCLIGVIVGTGTNACYMEKLENVPKWDGDQNDPKQVIINCEWGAFGCNDCIDAFRTDFDKELDAESINPGQQLFEKMISGMYLGEMVRKVIVKLSKDGLFGTSSIPDKLNTQGRFRSKYISFIERDKDNNNNTTSILKKMGYEEKDINEQIISTIQMICSIVSTRAAHLVAAGLATILNKMQRDIVKIGMDGSVYKFHPYFKTVLEEKLKNLCDWKFELILSEDGSGRGAALVAAVACRYKEQNKDKTVKS